MAKQNIKSKKGFTIIEVVLVLAIAGLIFLMVFVALPALQDSQRDTERKNNYSMIVTAMTNFSSTNRGKLPSNGTYVSGEGYGSDIQNPDTTFFKNYANEITDPDAGFYVLNISQPTGAISVPTSETGLQAGYVYVYKSSYCSDDTPSVPTYDSKLGARRYALYSYLAGAGSYCQDV